MAGERVEGRTIPAVRHQWRDDEQRYLGVAAARPRTSVSVPAQRRVRELGVVLARWEVGGLQLDGRRAARSLRVVVPAERTPLARVGRRRHPGALAPRWQGDLLPRSRSHADGGNGDVVTPRVL